MRKIIFSVVLLVMTTPVFAEKNSDFLTPAAVDENPLLLVNDSDFYETTSSGKMIPRRMMVLYSPTHGIKFTTVDGRTYTKLFGSIQVYSAHFNGDTKDTVNHVENFHNGLFIPSARLGLRGQMNADWKYKFEYDFAAAELNYVYLNYVGWQHVELKAGEYRPSVSSTGLTERVDRTFMERDIATETFFVNYSIGTEATFHKKNLTFSTGVFTPAFSSVNGVAITGGDPVGVNARLGVVPIHIPADLLHLGIGGYYRQAVASQYTRFRTYPEMLSNNALAVNLVDTGIINNSRGYAVSSAEAVNIAGPFAIEGDYYLTRVDRRLGNSLTFDGYYIAANYFLTGEKELYDYINGNFRGISKIRHASGAWELAARYSHVNLNSENVLGGKESDATLALNWYPIASIKLGINYIYANATPSKNGLNRHMNILGLQLQAQL